MFYEYRQNNSGGSFDVSDTVTYHVIIEAPSAVVADGIAKEIGIYFDGVGKDLDCECCGDRWSAASRYWAEYEGTVEPCFYNTPLLREIAKEKPFTFAREGEPDFYVYYADGSKGVYSYTNR